MALSNSTTLITKTLISSKTPLLSIRTLLSISLTHTHRQSQMSAFLLKAQLHTFIQSMYSEGMVNEQFLQIQLMKEGTPRQPEYAIRAITRYCLACTPIFSALTQLIDQGKVDFQSVHYLASDLYARSSSLGAENVRSACAELLQACERKDKNHCSQALYWVKHRFACLRIKVETLVLLERRIIDLEIIR